jgi:hypothetical protein
MHCGTFISFAFAIAALRSFCAPSNVSFMDGAVSDMSFSLFSAFIAGHSRSRTGFAGP